LGELTKNRPKSLVEIHHKPFLVYQIERLKTQGITDIVLCIGHLGDRIRDVFADGSKYGVHISYSIEDKPLGTAGALKNAAPLLGDTFFAMYGDSYLFLDYKEAMSYFLSRDKLALDTVYRNYDSYDKSNMLIEGDMVVKYSKTAKTPDMVYIDYGATIFKKEVLQFVPGNSRYALEDLFVRLIDMKQLLALEVKDRFYEIGSPQGLRDFEEFTRTNVK
ncbi:MAG: sugar phosphate nucleotidyltransferase, partial [Dehalococcoidales bacterium]|nr:sugar phosphate nucleotidyltransferase [Dehalococcoidales bacterium]